MKNLKYVVCLGIGFSALGMRAVFAQVQPLNPGFNPGAAPPRGVPAPQGGLGFPGGFIPGAAGNPQNAPGMAGTVVPAPGMVIPGMVIPGMVGGADNGQGEAAPVVPDRIYIAEENALSQVPRVVARFPGAVSLRASEEAFENNPAAKAALMTYVRRGGTVFLHTGAARAFGFVTVEARQGNNKQAGQLFGRARAALPFAAQPLLWDDGQPTRRSPNYDPTLLPGVNLVYYQLQPGDHLVVSHPAGTPLLQVTDLAADSPTPLYAAAIAPFGKGYAIFTPDIVDQKRADGALFTRNLLGMFAPSDMQARQWVGVPASAVEGAGNNPTALRAALAAAVNNSAPMAAPALPAFGTRAPAKPAFRDIPTLGPPEPDDNDQPAEPALPPDETQVIISRSEAASYGAMLDNGGQRASAAIGLLQARLLLARGDGNGASRVIENSADSVAEGSPDSVEIALWRGILLADSSQEINQSSVVRANLLADASRDLEAAANGTPQVANANARLTPRVAGISVGALRSWSKTMGQIAQVFALEPPFVQQYGVGEASITLRGVQGDAGLQLAAVGIDAVARSQNPGWHGDREEVIIFPTLEGLMAYRAALGLQGPTVPMPTGVAGDVLGQRIIMCGNTNVAPPIGDPALPQALPQAPNLGGLNTPDTFARLHSYVLLNALDEGGSGTPAYLQLGMEGLIAGVINGGLAADGTGLTQLAAAGTLLSPDQFTTVIFDPTQGAVARAQASSIMNYFYSQFGAGAVVETLQRLGTGQAKDEAYTATTNGGELALFQAWRDATFGPQRGPGDEGAGAMGRGPIGGLDPGLLNNG